MPLFESDIIDSWRAPSSIPFFLNPIVQVQLKPNLIPLSITLDGPYQVKFQKGCTLWIVAIGDPARSDAPMRRTPVQITSDKPINLYGFCERINLPGQEVDPSLQFPSGALFPQGTPIRGDIKNDPKAAALDQIVQRASEGTCSKGGANTEALQLTDLDTQLAVHLVFSGDADRSVAWQNLVNQNLNPLFVRAGVACLLKGSGVSTPTPTATLTPTSTPTPLLVVSSTPTPIPLLDQQEPGGGALNTLTLGQRGGLILAGLLLVLAIAAFVVLPALSSQRPTTRIMTALFVFAMSLLLIGLILRLR